MTDLNHYGNLSSKELHQHFGYKEAGLDSVEAFTTTLLLYEQLSLEQFGMYQQVAEGITAYYNALEREGFPGLSDTQIGLLKKTYEELQKGFDRMERIKSQLLDFLFLEKIPDQDIRDSLLPLILDGSIDGDMIGDLFDLLKSENPVDRLEAAEQAIFSANELFGSSLFTVGNPTNHREIKLKFPAV